MATMGAESTPSRKRGEHIPVMLEEVMESLQVEPGGHYFDATLGLGGHTRALLERSAPQGWVVATDRDDEALEAAKHALASFGGRLRAVHSSFSAISQVLEELGEQRGCLHGILADLGLSSRQLDDESRGFSFSSGGSLDMRMWAGEERSAHQLLEELEEEELGALFKELGEEPLGRRYARAVKEALARRKTQKELTPLELAQIIERAAGAKRRAQARRHPATKVFMALRMAVNDELGELEAFLKEAPAWLRPGGRLAVLSFHSLEDRMVKRRFKTLSSRDVDLPPGLPVREVDLPKSDFSRVTRKPLEASQEERLQNPRSRSAKLRVLERRREGV